MERRAPSSFGRGQVEPRSPVFRLFGCTGSPPLRVASATGPPTPDGALGEPPRRFVFAVCRETPPPVWVRPLPGLRARQHGSFPPAIPGGTPASAGRPSHRVRLRLAREPISSGRAADGRAGIGVFCLPNHANPRLSRALRSPCEGARGSDGRGPTSCCPVLDRGHTLRGVPAHGAALRTRLSRRDRGVHSRRNLADCHMVGASHSDPLGRGCQKGASHRGRAEGHWHRFRRTAARELER